MLLHRKGSRSRFSVFENTSSPHGQGASKLPWEERLSGGHCVNEHKLPCDEEKGRDGDQWNCMAVKQYRMLLSLYNTYNRGDIKPVHF